MSSSASKLVGKWPWPAPRAGLSDAARELQRRYNAVGLSAKLTKYWSIQVLRFVAALLVVCLHATGAVTMPSGPVGFYAGDFGDAGRIVGMIGRCGVDIFFVISGFIITISSRKATVSQFIERRAQRILPLYFSIALLSTVAAVTAARFGWRDLLATWFFWPATDRMTAPSVGVGWTLCFEVLFYTAFALAIWRPKAVWIVVIGYLFALAVRSGPVLQFLGNPVILEFLAGVGLAHAPKWRPAVLAIPVGVVMLVVCSWLGWPPMVDMATDALSGKNAWPRVVGLGIPAVLIVWGAIQLRARESVFTYLGDASYALYLIHRPIMALTVVVLAGYAKLPVNTAILCGVAASIVVAWRIHELVEKPAIAWLARRNQAAAV